LVWKFLKITSMIHTANKLDRFHLDMFLVPQSNSIQRDDIINKAVLQPLIIQATN